MKVFNLRFSDLAFHKDIRCGLSLIEYRNVVNRLVGSKFPLAKLGDVVVLEYGKGLTDEERTGEGYPVVGSNGIVGYHDEYLIEGPAIIVGRKGSAGEITYLEQPCYPIDTAFYVKPRSDFFSMKFLSYLLRLLRLQRLTLFKGVPGLNRFDAYEAKITLVPKEVQGKVLEKIEPIEHEIRGLQETLGDPAEAITRVFVREFSFNVARFEELRRQRTFFVEAGDFANNHDLRCSAKFHREAAQFVTSELRKLTDKSVKDYLAQDIVLGASVSPDDYDADGEFYYIAMSSIKSWHYDEEGARPVSDGYASRHQSKSVKESDIIMARSGEGTIGKVALIGEDVKGIFADFTMRIRLKGYLPEFAYYYFRTQYMQYLIETHKKGLGNNTNIFPNQVREFPMLDIPLTRQKAIVREILNEFSAQDKIKRRIEAKRKEIDRLMELALADSAGVAA